MKRAKMKVSIVLGTVLLVGCSSLSFSNLFLGYAQQMVATRSLVSHAQLEEARESLPEESLRSSSGILRALERGRLSFLAGDFPKSRATFNKVDERLEWLDSQAKLRLSQGIAQAGSLVSNDQQIPYDVPAYERALMHQYQTLNYLFAGDTSGALVEVRKANLVQREQLSRHDALQQNEIRTAEQQGGNWSAFSKRYPEPTSGQAQYANAAVFYLSAMLYEVTGDLNGAYVDLKRAYAVNPGNRQLQKDLLRVAAALGMRADLNRFKRQFGLQPHAADPNRGRLIVFAEQGLVPQRGAVGLPLPIRTTSGYFRLFNVAFPIYPRLLVSLPSPPVAVGDHRIETEPLNQVGPLAYGALREQLPVIFVREVLRLIAKEQIRKQATKEGGDVGNVVANIYNALSEQADTRSWNLLPAATRIARVELKPGKYKISLGRKNGNGQGEVPIQAGRTTLLWIGSIGRYQSAHAIVIGERP